MKKLFMLPFAFLLTMPLFAQDRTYDSSVPVIEEEYIEIEEDDFGDRMEQERLEQERMEAMEEAELDSEVDRRSYDGIDYTAPDRTRTNRERRALDTSSDASDDR